VDAFFFFQKKKQKALFCFEEDLGLSKPRRSRPLGIGGWPQKEPPQVVNWAGSRLLFPEKEAKSVVLLRRRIFPRSPSAKRNHGGLGAGPQKEPKKWSIGLGVVFFYWKRSKKRCSASQKNLFPKSFREAEPRGFGGWSFAQTLNNLQICFILFLSPT
jgi:hypothetical protein